MRGPAVDGGLHRRQPFLDLAHLQQPRGGLTQGDEGAHPGDAVLEPEGVGRRDLQQTADSGDALQPLELVRPLERALAPAPQSAQPPGLGGFLCRRR